MTCSGGYRPVATKSPRKVKNVVYGSLRPRIRGGSRTTHYQPHQLLGGQSAMLKDVLSISAISVIAAAALVAVPSAAQAANATPGCVTRAEYRSVSKGMAMTSVHARFGTSGHRESTASMGGYATTLRTYKVCHQPYSSIAMTFDKKPGGVFRLSARSALWVS